MEAESLPHNTHLLSVDDFAHTDVHLRRMNQQRYVFHSAIIDELPTGIPGIYNLGGGRQIGKTTLLKQWMQHLLQLGVAPDSIAFLACELIIDETSLYRIVSDQLNTMPRDSMQYLILDEITYVANWDRAIKALADSGIFDQVVVVISGSDLVMMQEARKRFPGRRGKADKVDFHYCPLSFRQCVELKGKLPTDKQLNSPSDSLIKNIYAEFRDYLIHGGFLTAINEHAMTGSISLRTLATYSDWIRGDVIKQGKNENYLREIMSAIIKHYSSQTSLRNLVDSLTIDHVQTAIDYTNLLESMDAIFIQAALIEDKLAAAPKKPRKYMFRDPFIFHAIRTWLKPNPSPFEQQIMPAVEDNKLSSLLVESVVITHSARHYPTYYIKADNEVDVAYVHCDKFWPIEVKWTNQIRAKDLKQVLKYKNGQIWSKVKVSDTIGNTPVLLLPFGLLNSPIA
jgi:hypothetical protein